MKNRSLHASLQRIWRDCQQQSEDGTPLRHGGIPLREILEYADADTYRVPLSPTCMGQLSQLDELDEATSRQLDAGYVDVQIGHLGRLDPEARVRVGYVLDFSAAEIQRLGL